MVYEGSGFAASHMMLMKDPATQDPEPGYNDRSELTEADRKTGTTPESGELFSPNGDFDYAYDNIGNRETYGLDDPGTPTIYTANDLNQYGDLDPQRDAARLPTDYAFQPFSDANGGDRSIRLRFASSLASH